VLVEVRWDAGANRRSPLQGCIHHRRGRVGTETRARKVPFTHRLIRVHLLLPSPPAPLLQGGRGV